MPEATRLYRYHTSLLPETGSEQHAMVTIDYAKIHYFVGIDGDSAKSLSIFSVVVRKNSSEQHPLDTFSYHKQNEKFVQKAISKFETRIRGLIGPTVQYLHIWSDGGLQTYGTIKFFHELQKRLGIELELNFFEAYHGHNRCDGHFAHLKKTVAKGIESGYAKLLQQQNHSKDLAMIATELANRLKNTIAIFCDDVAQELEEKLKNWEISN